MFKFFSFKSKSPLFHLYGKKIKYFIISIWDDREALFQNRSQLNRIFKCIKENLKVLEENIDRIPIKYGRLTILFYLLSLW